MDEIKCVVVTPESTVLQETVSFVVVPLADGELGIGTGHSPLIGRLGFGELRYRQADRTVHYYIDEGFVQVANDVVSVLTQRAVLAADVDQAAAQEQLLAARQRPVATPDQEALRDRLLSQARAQLRVSRRALPSR